MKILFWLSGFVVVGVFVYILWDIVWLGAGQITWDYLTQVPQRAGLQGGISSILAGTGLLLLVALGTSLPLGVGCAVYLAEFASDRDLFPRLVRRSLDILSGVPSIVFGLFGMVFFSQFLRLGWSILSGGLTLSCMALPLVIRASEEGLRSVPQELRSGCWALGISKARALWRIFLPAALPGIMAGLILGLGRALAETAAVMFTAGASIRMPTSLLSSSRSLSYHIYILSMEVPGGIPRAYAAAFVLVVLLLAIHLSTHWMVNRWLLKTGVRESWLVTR